MLNNEEDEIVPDISSEDLNEISLENKEGLEINPEQMVTEVKEITENVIDIKESTEAEINNIEDPAMRSEFHGKQKEIDGNLSETLNSFNENIQKDSEGSGVENNESQTTTLSESFRSFFRPEKNKMDLWIEQLSLASSDSTKKSVIDAMKNTIEENPDLIEEGTSKEEIMAELKNIEDGLNIPQKEIFKKTNEDTMEPIIPIFISEEDLPIKDEHISPEEDNLNGLDSDLTPDNDNVYSEDYSESEDFTITEEELKDYSDTTPEENMEYINFEEVSEKYRTDLEIDPDEKLSEEKMNDMEEEVLEAEEKYQEIEGELMDLAEEMGKIDLNNEEDVLKMEAKLSEFSDVLGKLTDFLKYNYLLTEQNSPNFSEEERIKRINLIKEREYLQRLLKKNLRDMTPEEIDSVRRSLGKIALAGGLITLLAVAAKLASYAKAAAAGAAEKGGVLAVPAIKAGVGTVAVKGIAGGALAGVGALALVGLDKVRLRHIEWLTQQKAPGWLKKLEDDVRKKSKDKDKNEE